MFCEKYIDWLFEYYSDDGNMKFVWKISYKLIFFNANFVSNFNTRVCVGAEI